MRFDESFSDECHMYRDIKKVKKGQKYKSNIVMKIINNIGLRLTVIKRSLCFARGRGMVGTFKCSCRCDFQ